MPKVDSRLELAVALADNVLAMPSCPADLWARAKILRMRASWDLLWSRFRSR